MIIFRNNSPDDLRGFACLCFYSLWVLVFQNIAKIAYPAEEVEKVVYFTQVPFGFLCP